MGMSPGPNPGSGSDSTFFRTTRRGAGGVHLATRLDSTIRVQVAQIPWDTAPPPRLNVFPHQAQIKVMAPVSALPQGPPIGEDPQGASTHEEPLPCVNARQDGGAGGGRGAGDWTRWLRRGRARAGP